MTIATSVNKVFAQGNGATTAFSFSFLMPAAANAVVTVTDSSGNRTVLSATQYSLSGVGNPNGGTLNYPLTGSPLAVGSSISLQRVLPLQQLTSLINQAGYFPNVVEGALDQLEMQIQQIAAVTIGNVSVQFPSSDPLTLNAILPSAATRANTTLGFDSLGNVAVFTPVAGSAAAVLTALADSSNVSNGDALVAVKQPFAGAVARTQHDKNTDLMTVKDYGAIGTVVPGNVTADTIAFSAAKAASKRVLVPEGTFYLSAGYSIDPGNSLIGAGTGKTIIIYTGTGNGIYMGAPGNIALAYDCALAGITLICINRAATVNGVFGENLVYGSIDDITVIGSGNPVSVTPADWVLFGAGIMLSNNSIITRVSRASARLWNIGLYLKTLPASQSYWTAAIAVSGQGEYANNMIGVVVGDPTNNLASGVGCAFRDISIQGNYTTGMVINTGDNTVVDNVYFEGNANYDVVVGNGSGAVPIGVKIIHCPMESESIGTTNYGTFPYIAKVRVVSGAQAKIRDNNTSISTAIPLVIVDAAATETAVTGNRLNSTAAATARISNASSTTITADNSPEAPRIAIDVRQRLLNAASGNVSYTGLGFRPTSVEFWCAVDAANVHCEGAADASSGLQNRCTTTDGAGAILSSANCIRIIRVAAGNEQKATLVSFDADGFTLAWVLVGAPPAETLQINFIARR